MWFLVAALVLLQQSDDTLAAALADMALDNAESTKAIRNRLAEHQQWDACVKTKALQFSVAEEETAEAIAQATLGACLQHESRVQGYASETSRILKLEGEALRVDVDRMMSRWRQVQRQTALAIVLEARTGN